MHYTLSDCALARSAAPSLGTRPDKDGGRPLLVSLRHGLKIKKCQSLRWMCRCLVVIQAWRIRRRRLMPPKADSLDSGDLMNAKNSDCGRFYEIKCVCTLGSFRSQSVKLNAVGKKLSRVSPNVRIPCCSFAVLMVPDWYSWYTYDLLQFKYNLNKEGITLTLYIRKILYHCFCYKIVQGGNLALCVH